MQSNVASYVNPTWLKNLLVDEMLSQVQPFLVVDMIVECMELWYIESSVHPIKTHKDALEHKKTKWESLRYSNTCKRMYSSHSSIKAFSLVKESLTIILIFTRCPQKILVLVSGYCKRCCWAPSWRIYSYLLIYIMHKITMGWLTMRSHVYNHNYRAICIIFTCEL